MFRHPDPEVLVVGAGPAAEEALRRKELKVLWGHRLQALTVDGGALRAEVAKLDLGA